jgi:hypothetical protein
MIEWRLNGQAVIKKRLQQAHKDGDLKGTMNPADFARYLSSLMAGLGIQAANGATKSEMNRIANIALHFMGY